MIFERKLTPVKVESIDFDILLSYNIETEQLGMIQLRYPQYTVDRYATGRLFRMVFDRTEHLWATDKVEASNGYTYDEIDSLLDAYLNFVERDEIPSLEHLDYLFSLPGVGHDFYDILREINPSIATINDEDLYAISQLI